MDCPPQPTRATLSAARAAGRLSGAGRSAPLTLVIDDEPDEALAPPALPLPAVSAAAAESVPAAGGTRFWRRALYGGLSALLSGALLLPWLAAQPVHKGERLSETLLAARLSSEMTAAEQARNWTLVAKKAGDIVELQAVSPQVRDVAQRALEQAAAEQQNLLVYDRFLDASSRRAFDAAVLSFAELSDGSVYRELGALRYLEMRRGFIKGHVLRAQLLQRRHSCHEAQPHLDAILAVDPAAAADDDVRTLLDRCSKAAPEEGTSTSLRPLQQQDLTQALTEQQPAPRRGPASGGRKQSPLLTPGLWARPPGEARAREGKSAPGRGPAARGEAVATADPPAMHEAQRAYISGDYQLAIRIARHHVDQDPEHAWRVIGSAACYLGDSKLVRETLDHLDDPAQHFVRLICDRNRVTP